MEDSPHDELMTRLLDVLEREYGRRNIHVDEDRIRIRSYDPTDVTIHVYDYGMTIFAYLDGEADYRNFPTDGSKYRLEQLAKQYNGPGSYINADGTLYVPNYSLTLKDSDLDPDGFIVTVIDRLTDMARFGSDMFRRSLEKEADIDDILDDPEFDDLDFLFDEDSDGTRSESDVGDGSS